MRKFLLSILLIVCVVVYSDASMVMRSMVDFPGTVAESDTCTTVHVTNTGVATGDYDITDDADFFYVGQTAYDPGATVSICKVDAYLSYNSGDISGKTYTMSIWTLTGSDLNANQGSSAGVTGNNSWSDEAVTFRFTPSVTVTNGTDYAIVITTGSVDAANWAGWEYTAAGGVDGAVARFQSDGTYMAASAVDAKMVIYKE